MIWILAMRVMLPSLIAQQPTVSTVQQLLTMSGEEAAKGLRVHLDGTVIYADPVRREALFKDSTGVTTVRVDLQANPIEGGKRVTLDGKTSAELTRYPDHPTGYHYPTSFEAPTTVGDWYFARLRGFIHPPETAEYTFWIASDNSSGLWLSTDEKPENAKKIAALQFGYTGIREWEKSPGQRSAKVQLEAGRRYYIEALHWEENGEDHLSVAWERPGAAREIIAGEFLSPIEMAGGSGLAPRRGSILREYWLGYPFPDDRSVAVANTTSTPIEELLKNPPTYYHRPTIAEARITVSAEQPPLAPRALMIGQPWERAEDFSWAEAEGVITQVTNDGFFWTSLELRDDGGRLHVRLANPRQENLEGLLHARVRMQGFCEGGFTVDGRRVATDLWVAGAQDISQLPPRDDDWANVPLVSFDDLHAAQTGLRAGQRVRLLGRVLKSEAGQPLVIRDTVSRFSGLVSPDGKKWTQITDAVAIPMNHAVYVGLGLATPANLGAATFDRLSVPLDATSDIDIGHPPLPGSSQVEGETITLKGSGAFSRMADAPTTDQLHYLYWRMNGDAEISARILSVSAPENTPFPGANAGIMLRETLEPDAKSAYLFVASSAVVGAQFGVRREKGNPIESFGSGEAAPYWLKLVRRSVPPITIHSSQTLLLPHDQPVEAMGVLARADENWTLQQAFYRAVQGTTVTKTTDERQIAITTVQQIRQLTAEALAQVRPAKIRGIVTAKTADLYVQDTTGGIRVPASAWQKFAHCEVGHYVEVDGRCVAGLYSPELQPSQSSQVVSLGRGQMPEAVARTWNQLMEGRDDAQWVEVRGVVRSLQGRTLRLQMAGGSELTDLAFDFPPDHARRLVDATVRIQGVCQVIANEKRQLIGTRLIVPAAQFVIVEEPPPADPFAAAAQPLGNLRQFAGQNQLAHRAKLEGVVTNIRPGSFFIENATGGIEVEAVGELTLARGDQVEVLGFSDSRGQGVYLADAIARKTGSAALPQPMRIVGDGLPQAVHGARLIAIDAVYLGRSTLLGNEVFQFQKGERVFQALLPEDHGSVPALEPGSLVALVGVCRVIEDRAGNYSVSNPEFEVLLSSPADVVVRAKPPWWNLRRLLWVGGIFVGVLAVAAIWIATILRKNRLLRRAQAELQSANEGLETRVAARTADLAQANAELSYEQSLLRTLLDSSPDQIYFKDLQSRFLKASRAQVADFGVQSADELIGKTDFDFFAEEHARPAYNDEQEIIRTGQPLIGKIEKEIRKNGETHWVLTSKMPLRNKTGEIVGTFGISKNITSIIEAEARLAEVNKQLVDKSRQAGMAEVATGILHNVGNVLNSVNVSATFLLDRIRTSRVEKVPKLSALFKEHADDLGNFLTTDPRGRMVPGYLQSLANELIAEQKSIVGELDHLRENIEHIKEIVAMQQNYAKVSGVTELVDATVLVEDALRMNGDGLVRHGVKVVREYEQRPMVTTERHKVLEILINLIQNAKYACDGKPVPERQVTLRVTERAERVRIAVIDTGVGIAAENLTRIFAHGFTTRKEGHGFGLHHGALAAKELGGSLRVESPGLGQGATFTLELPLQPPTG